MAEITADNISELWSYLGTVWGNLSLDDKTFMEQLWTAYVDVVEPLTDELVVIKENRSINDISPILTERDIYYDIIYATSDDDEYGTLINTFTTPSGLYGFQLKDVVLDVSGVINYHYVDEENPWVAEALVEGTDFIISGYNSLIFLNDPPFTASVDYPSLSRSIIYINKLEKLNPALPRLWGKQIEANLEVFTDDSYTCWSQYSSGLDYYQISAEHYRQIIRALTYWSKQVPTIKTIKHSVGIAYGLPFAYESGILTHYTTGDAPAEVLGSEVLDSDNDIFELGLGDWDSVGGGVTTQDAVITYGGSLGSMKTDNDTNKLDFDVDNVNKPVDGVYYRLSMYIYDTDPLDLIQVFVDPGDGSGDQKLIEFNGGASGWVYKECYFTCGGLTGPKFSLTNKDALSVGARITYYDNISLKPYSVTADTREYHAELNDQEFWFTVGGQMEYLIEGSHNRFELLVDSFNIYDYISNSTLIEQYMDSSTEADKYNILIAETSSGLINEFPFTYDTDLYAEWLLRVIPKQIKFIEIP